jgi:predicted CXXCH cytochrome family protein
MERTELSIGRTKKPMITILSLLLLIGVVPLNGWSAETGQGRCMFVKFLENPSFRDRYRNNLVKARIFDEDKNFDSQAMYNNIVKASVSNGDDKKLGTLDSFSTGCIACHNGLVSPQESLNFKNNPDSRMQMLSGKHPIGMDYARYAAANSTLRKVNELNPKLVLVGGKVSCVTCHDALNPEKNHLALNTSGQDLCLECHAM